MSPIVKLYQKIKHDIEESIRYADTEELGPLTVTMTVLNIMDKNIWNKILMKYCKKMESLTI